MGDCPTNFILTLIISSQMQSLSHNCIFKTNSAIVLANNLTNTKYPFRLQKYVIKSPDYISLSFRSDFFTELCDACCHFLELFGIVGDRSQVRLYICLNEQNYVKALRSVPSQNSRPKVDQNCHLLKRPFVTPQNSLMGEKLSLFLRDPCGEIQIHSASSGLLAGEP
jgi:hypothetical protein